LSWQITPAVLTDSLSDPDAGVRERVFTAMMGMKKIDISAINAARTRR
jgi:2-polyprenyl-6-hydroxyphenyl methylase/3-demethylubiquinone-9 3-methyltransferase